MPDPTPPLPVAALELCAARELALRFRGSAREYFRIWVVNLCLTLLTLGVFSAWAKVRKKRYFYAHTTLDGTPFQYLGEPLPILRGRVVAVILLAVYYAASNFFTTLLPYVLVAGLVLAPWVIVRSAAFNARYSAFRNLTFRFDGDYRAAFKTIYWLGLIPLLVVAAMFEWSGNTYAIAGAFALFGFAFPWWLARLKAFIVGRTGYGGRHGVLSARGGQFFRVYFVAGVIVTLAAAVTGVAVMALHRLASAAPYTPYLFALPVYAGYVLAYAYVQARIGNLVWNQTRLGPLGFRSTLRARGLTALYLGNALAILGSLGLLIPWAVVRTLRYRLDNLQVLLDGTLAEFCGTPADAVRAAGAEVGEFFDVDLSL